MLRAEPLLRIQLLVLASETQDAALALARAALTGDPLGYRLEGSFSVDAGSLGSPRFGPLTLLNGSIRVR